MSDDTIKDSPSATQDSSKADKSTDKSEDRGCCYVVDPCNCYCNPYYMPVSCCC